MWLNVIYWMWHHELVCLWCHTPDSRLHNLSKNSLACWLEIVQCLYCCSSLLPGTDIPPPQCSPRSPPLSHPLPPRLFPPLNRFASNSTEEQVFSPSLQYSRKYFWWSDSKSTNIYVTSMLHYSVEERAVRNNYVELRYKITALWSVSCILVRGGQMSLYLL